MIEASKSQASQSYLVSPCLKRNKLSSLVQHFIAGLLDLLVTCNQRLYILSQIYCKLYQAVTHMSLVWVQSSHSQNPYESLNYSLSFNIFKLGYNKFKVYFVYM